MNILLCTKCTGEIKSSFCWCHLSLFQHTKKKKNNNIVTHLKRSHNDDEVWGCFMGLYTHIAILELFFCGPLNTTSSIKIQLFMLCSYFRLYVLWVYYTHSVLIVLIMTLRFSAMKGFKLKWVGNSLIWIAYDGTYMYVFICSFTVYYEHMNMSS